MHYDDFFYFFLSLSINLSLILKRLIQLSNKVFFELVDDFLVCVPNGEIGINPEDLFFALVQKVGHLRPVLISKLIKLLPSGKFLLFRFIPFLAFLFRSVDCNNHGRQYFHVFNIFVLVLVFWVTF